MLAKDGPSLHTAVGFQTNHPRCKSHCGKLARPAILMFGDSTYVHHKKKDWKRFNNWTKTVKECLINDPNSKLVIVEVGCGKNVPTVRYFLTFQR
jgi:hypothetical protein